MTVHLQRFVAKLSLKLTACSMKWSYAGINSLQTKVIHESIVELCSSIQQEFPLGTPELGSS